MEAERFASLFVALVGWVVSVQTSAVMGSNANLAAQATKMTLREKLEQTNATTSKSSILQSLKSDFDWNQPYWNFN